MSSEGIPEAQGGEGIREAALVGRDLKRQNAHKSHISPCLQLFGSFVFMIFSGWTAALKETAISMEMTDKYSRHHRLT